MVYIFPSVLKTLVGCVDVLTAAIVFEAELETAVVDVLSSSSLLDPSTVVKVVYVLPVMV